MTTRQRQRREGSKAKAAPVKSTYIGTATFKGEPSDLSDIATDKIAQRLIAAISYAEEQYFAPLENSAASGDVDTYLISDINRLAAELTSRFLLSGF